MTAAPRVPKRQASGTSRFGFSTAAEFCAADSMPRKAQSVREMLDPMPAPRLSPCGFQASRKMSDLNQNQPASDRNPKLATVVSQSSPMTPRVVAIGVDESQGKNVARYPTAEIPMATLPIASERK